MTSRNEARQRRIGERNETVLRVICELADRGDEAISFSALEAALGRQYPERFDFHNILGALLYLDGQSLLEGFSPATKGAIPLFRPTEQGVESWKAAL